MKPTPSIVRAALAFCLIASCLLLGQATSRAYPPPTLDKPQDFQNQEDIRQAGLHGDRSKIPLMISTLADTMVPSLAITTLHALAQLGAVEALPTIDHAPARVWPYLINQFSVERARLLAEDSTRNIKDGKERARQKIARFYQELNLSPEQLGPAAQLYETNGGTYTRQQVPVEMYAMEEIADMVYHGSYKDYADVPGVAQVDFQHDYGAWIKMKMAPLSPAEQATWLINDLSHKKAMVGQEGYEMHLAAELGMPAGEAAVAKLQEMDAHQSDYSAAGVEALLSIVSATANPASKAIHECFKNNAHPYVADAAKSGGGVGRIPGY